MDRPVNLFWSESSHYFGANSPVRNFERTVPEESSREELVLERTVPEPLKLYQESAMGGFLDILSKVISSIRRFVDHDIWLMRCLGDYDVWLTTTYRLIFVELRQNSSKFSRKHTRTNSDCCFFFFFFFFIIITSNLKAL